MAGSVATYFSRNRILSAAAKIFAEKGARTCTVEDILQAAYLKAFESLKAGKYDAAITGFRGMLEKWPQGNFSDNGWYWMGETYNVKQQYKAAPESFDTLVERFPASPKVPDALFKAGLSHWSLKETTAAKADWQRVVKDYPSSNAAGLARRRLEQAR